MSDGATVRHGDAAAARSQRLKELIEAPEILVVPGVYDGYSTRLAEAAGFRCAIVSGACVSESSLGWADVGLMGLEENLRVARALRACSSLPLLADADTGYGNAVNVYFTVRGFEQAGLDGVMIEDQVWPKRCGHIPGKEVISADEMVEKVRAAVAARRNPDFVIKARTDAFASHGLRETIERLNRYREAGADLLFADALLSRSDIAAVAREVKGPLAVNMGFGLRARATTPLLSARELEDLGVAVVLYPRLLAAAALRGMKTALETFADALGRAVPLERPELMASFDEINELTGLGEIQRLEQAFLMADQLQRKYGQTRDRD